MKRFSLMLAAVLAACGPLDDDPEHPRPATVLAARDAAVIANHDEPLPDESPPDESPPDEPVPDDEPPADVVEPPDEPVDVEPAPAPTCSSAPRAPRPATCPFVNEVVVWGQEGWNALAEEFRANLSPCTDVFISIPPVTADKTTLRPGQAQMMRERGPQFHAMAEFHYATWKQNKDALGLTWREVGRRFRDEMDAKGYCVEAGDIWAINEAPSAIRRDAGFRAGFAELVAGLAEGRDGMPFVKGAVFLAGMGHATTNMSLYKPNLKEWLQDAPFWVAINNDVRFFGGEVYVDPRFTCLGNTAAVDRRRRVNRYTEHLFRLAVAGPDTVNTAQSFLSRAFVPVMNAVWDASLDRGYGDTTISLDNMHRFIRMQVDATRTFADTNTSPDGRIGFAFASYHAPDEWAALGATVADAIAGAYGEGATAGGACAGEGCSCTTSGAAENTAWAAFASW